MPNWFLDEYPRWEIDRPHQSIILHNMFLHAAEQGWKEVERFIWQGHLQSLPRLDPEVDVPTIKHVGYCTSCQEIRDLYHSVYLLRRSPGPPSCGPQWREEVIWDILSSLRDHLHRQGYTATPKEEAQGVAAAAPLSAHQWEFQSRSRRREDPDREALQGARKAHQLVLEAAHMLECDIERLSREVEDIQYPCPHSHSSSHPQSQSLDRDPRSPSRHRWERRVTFWEPEVELDPSEWPYRGP